MTGKYIINQTAGKRYIILEEDAEKIEGGYFDTEGVWHDLSGPLDGDLLGKYVINETGGKRIILLEEDSDEIGGGYFDEDGTWHDFGGFSFTLANYDATLTYGYFKIHDGRIDCKPWSGNQSCGSIHRDKAVASNAVPSPVDTDFGLSLKAGDVLTLKLTNCVYPAETYTNFRIYFWILDTDGNAHYRSGSNTGNLSEITIDQTIDADYEVSDIMVGAGNVGIIQADVEVLLNGQTISEVTA